MTSTVRMARRPGRRRTSSTGSSRRRSSGFPIYFYYFQDHFYIHATDNYYRQTPFAKVLTTCKGFTNGCLIDQGPCAYVDARAFYNYGSGYLPRGTYPWRSGYPQVYYPYSTTTAFNESVTDSTGVSPLVMVIWQFRRGVLYMSSGAYGPC